MLEFFRQSNESQECKEKLLASYDLPSKNPIRCECESGKKTRYSTVLPWLISLTLSIVLVVLEASPIRTKIFGEKGFWAPTEFRTFTLFSYNFSISWNLD